MKFSSLIVLLVFGFFCHGQQPTSVIRVTTETTFLTYKSKQGWEPVKPKVDDSIIKTTFSARGFRLKEERYQNSNPYEQTTYHYHNERIMAINHHDYQKDSVIRKDIIQEYVQNIYPSKIDRYDSNNKLIDYLVYGYNNQQQLVKTTVYKTDGKIIVETNIEYDSQSNVIRVTTTNDSKAFTYTDYTYLSYDGNGNWTQRLEIKNSGEPVLNIRTIEYY